MHWLFDFIYRKYKRNEDNYFNESYCSLLNNYTSCFQTLFFVFLIIKTNQSSHKVFEWEQHNTEQNNLNSLLFEYFSTVWMDSTGK